MSKVKSIKVPYGNPESPDYREVWGNIVLLALGDKKHKFFIHESLDGLDTCLADYASGLVVGKLNAIKVSSMRSYQKMTDRGAAESLLERLIVSHGLDRVKSVIENAPRIN